MTPLNEYLRGIQEEISPELRSDLAPLESGGQRNSQRKGFGPWVDTTQSDIQRLKKSISAYESVLGHRSK
jgi:hypothetical protein